MNNDERIIKYLDGELQEEEKALFEKDLSDSEVLRNEFAAYKKVITAFDEQKVTEHLRSILQTAKDNVLEIILKDTITLNGKPELLNIWSQIARREVDALWG